MDKLEPQEELITIGKSFVYVRVIAYHFQQSKVKSLLVAFSISFLSGYASFAILFFRIPRGI
jgi:hypothetical protein